MVKRLPCGRQEPVPNTASMVVALQGGCAVTAPATAFVPIGRGDALDTSTQAQSEWPVAVARARQSRARGPDLNLATRGPYERSFAELRGPPISMTVLFSCPSPPHREAPPRPPWQEAARGGSRSLAVSTSRGVGDERRLSPEWLNSPGNRASSRRVPRSSYARSSLACRENARR